MTMTIYGSNPIIDKEKIIIFDYEVGTYKSNSYYSFKVPIKTGSQWVSFIFAISVLLLVVIISFIILNITSKKKKINKSK